MGFWCRMGGAIVGLSVASWRYPVHTKTVDLTTVPFNYDSPVLDKQPQVENGCVCTWHARAAVLPIFGIASTRHRYESVGFTLSVLEFWLRRAPVPCLCAEIVAWFQGTLPADTTWPAHTAYRYKLVAKQLQYNKWRRMYILYFYKCKKHCFLLHF